MSSEEAKESSKGVSSCLDAFGGHIELKNWLEVSLGEKWGGSRKKSESAIQKLVRTITFLPNQ